jgi:hypothetical protein
MILSFTKLRLKKVIFKYLFPYIELHHDENKDLIKFRAKNIRLTKKIKKINNDILSISMLFVVILIIVSVFIKKEKKQIDNASIENTNPEK